MRVCMRAYYVQYDDVRHGQRFLLVYCRLYPFPPPFLLALLSLF